MLDGATALLLGAPATAGAAPPAVRPDAASLLAAVRTPGTAWGVDAATGRMALTVDDTVTAREAAALGAPADAWGPPSAAPNPRAYVVGRTGKAACRRTSRAATRPRLGT
ncbi:alpha-lytic protease prodomain-containing protein [Plantactinospora sp. GCM10030261]|uniref:alpha-lytic protease prodomain-containing protein n=1 Tax=Plantactinospora sp. GCM10030261 TaxID=3273420 RepID=UPI003616A23F